MTNDVIDEAAAVLMEAKLSEFPATVGRTTLHCTVAAALELHETRKPIPPDPELLATLKRDGYGRDLAAEYREQLAWWEEARAKLTAEPMPNSVPGWMLFGYPLVIHKDGPARFWLGGES